MGAMGPSRAHEEAFGRRRRPSAGHKIRHLLLFLGEKTGVWLRPSLRASMLRSVPSGCAVACVGRLPWAWFGLQPRGGGQQARGGNDLVMGIFFGFAQAFFLLLLPKSRPALRLSLLCPTGRCLPGLSRGAGAVPWLCWPLQGQGDGASPV